jgi:hypothetical protein
MIAPTDNLQTGLLTVGGLLSNEANRAGTLEVAAFIGQKTKNHVRPHPAMGQSSKQ